MRIRSAIILLSAWVGCQQPEEPPRDHGGKSFLDLRMGNEWIYDLVSMYQQNYAGNVAGYDSTRRRLTLVGRTPTDASGGYGLVFRIEDTVFRGERIDSLGRPILTSGPLSSSRFDTLPLEGLDDTNAYPAALPSMEFFVPPPESLSSVPMNGGRPFRFGIREGRVVRISGKDFATLVVSMVGDTAMYLGKAGLYSRKRFFQGGLTTQSARIRLRAFNRESFD